MTDKYRSEIFSRIRKLNFTNSVAIGQAVRLFLLFFAVFALFFGVGYITNVGENTKNAILDFFCQGFGGTGFLGWSKQALRFSSYDFYTAALIAASGYTMVAVPASTLCLAFWSAQNGFCFAILWKILINSGELSGSGATFAYFSICKLCILAAVIFISICARDFSYRFSDIYRRTSHPISSPESANYALITVSSAGFTVLINLLFLTFQYISPSSYI